MSLFLSKFEFLIKIRIGRMTDTVPEEEKLTVPDGWKPEEFKPEHNPNGCLEESKFRFLLLHQLIFNEKLVRSFQNTEKNTSKKCGRLSKSSWRLTI